MKNFLMIPALALALGMLGCASTGQVDKLQANSETNQKLLRENEFRLGQLEKSVASLNTQVAQLNNRVYEVRNGNGKRTSLTVVPIISPVAASAPAVAATATQPTAQSAVATASTPAASPPVAQATAPNSRAQALLASARKVAAERNKTAQTPVADASAASAASAPKGRMIDPAAAPTPIPAVASTPRTSAPQATAQRSAGAMGSMGRPVAGASGSLSAQAADIPAALPPIDLPAQGQAQAATAKPAKAAQGVPVPEIPSSGLALPAEHPGLPPLEQPQATTPKAGGAAAQAQVAPQAHAAAPAVSATSLRGEEAAYKTALNATLAGRTQEGLRLFRDFLQQYPHGRYAANADYWIGECLYAQGKYQEALAQFQNVNNAYPRHHKNADALLKAGMTMSRLGDKAAAAEKYRTLLAQFPNSEAASRARAMGLAR